MTTPLTVPPAASPDDTLANILRRVAYAQLPGRFYAALELSAPMAVQAALAGRYRIAGVLTTISCFGLWAIAQQHVTGHADLLGVSALRPSRPWHMLRRTAAVIGVGVASLLAAEAFTRVLAVVFKCPGCAG